MRDTRHSQALVPALAMGIGLLGAMSTPESRASDHLDTPTVEADPRADIGDIYAWTSVDGRRLNLVMTIVGHTFSDSLAYTFHVGSGKEFGRTTLATDITCRFNASHAATCEAGNERAEGWVDTPGGFLSQDGQLKVFAGRRDDPFFNNVRGSRSAFDVAANALKQGVKVDADGFPSFDAKTVQAIKSQWRQTDGGPGKNFLAGWTPASIVISVDLHVVNGGGPLLAVWGETASAHGRIDRAGRPLTGNALLSPLDADRGTRLKERYNRAEPATSRQFIADIQQSLGLYDGYDGVRGNQWLADIAAAPGMRYLRLATLLADDRLWVNSASAKCTTLFAVELAHLSGRANLASDCGGRTPNYDASNIYRSLLAAGNFDGIDDGVHHDDHAHSAATFPFLAAADAAAAEPASTGKANDYRE